MTTLIQKIKNWINPKTEQPIFKTEDVFRINGVPEHTFVERDNLNKEIDTYLKTKEGILLFLGYSKSGKTVFRQKHIEEQKVFTCIKFCANHKSTIEDLYRHIASSFQLEQLKEKEQSKKTSSTNESDMQLGNETLGHFGGKKTKNLEKNTSVTSEYCHSEVDVNFLCSKLANKNVLVTIEDYHLVSDEFNRLMSEDLKHFLDDNILFLLIGIPSCPNRALKNNPDLSGRMNRINFDYLLDDEVKQIITKGCELLNVEFSDDVINKIIESSLKNAYLVQYICRTTLINNNINETGFNKIKIDDVNEIKKACKTIAKKLDNDYLSIYNIIISGARSQKSDKAFNQYEELLKSIRYFNIDDIEKGIDYTTISTWTWNEMSEDKKRTYIENRTYQSEQSFKTSISSQIKNAMDNLNKNMANSSVKPILYINNGCLYLSDLVFKFYINWKDF